MRCVWSGVRVGAIDTRLRRGEDADTLEASIRGREHIEWRDTSYLLCIQEGSMEAELRNLEVEVHKGQNLDGREK